MNSHTRNVQDTGLYILRGIFSFFIPLPLMLSACARYRANTRFAPTSLMHLPFSVFARYRGNMRFAPTFLILLLLMLSACAPKQGPGPGVAPPAHPKEKTAEIARFDISVLPATWKGTLPCPDCAGTKYHLNLLPDHSFKLKRTFLASGNGTSREIVDSGTWQLSPDATELTLRFSGNLTEKFRAVSDKCLQQIPGNMGMAIKPDTTRQICRAERLEPVSASREMRGLYSYMADLGMFMDCDTGRRYPVAMEKDNARLEQAYLKAKHGVAEPLIVRFQGYITTRPAMEGSRMNKVVVVEHFIEITSARSCREPESQASAITETQTGSLEKLENTRWELIEIAGEPVSALPGSPPPGFRLNPQGKSLRGFGGCNRIMGSYTLEGDRLSFGPIATTRRFCEESQGLEDRFVQAIEQVRTFKLNGDILELYGEYGLLARLRAADTNSHGL